MNIQNKRFWTEFLELYRSFPALWKLKSEEYQNRRLKSKCYERMVDKLREMDPDANRDTVKRKINTFRSNYRRGLRMMRQSIGAPPGERYESTLWYFDLLRFLDGEDHDIDAKRSFLLTDSDSMPAVNISVKRRNFQMKTRKSNEVPDDDDDEEEEEEFDEQEMDDGEMEPKVENISIGPTHCYTRKSENDTKELNGVSATKRISLKNNDHRRRNQSNNEEKLLALECSQVKKQKVQQPKLEQQHDANIHREIHRKPTDDSVVLASGWATQYAELTNLQKIFARKIISDVLFHGCLEHLDESAVQRIQIELAPPSDILTATHTEFIDSNEAFEDDV